jgi:Mg2+ and Co2+ transporter CorA
VAHSGHTVIEQMSFYLKDNILITFQETPKDLFDSIKSKYFVQICRVLNSVYFRSYSTRQRSYKKI